MSSRIHEEAMSTQSMLCPCCGITILSAASDCKCGARFVGKPLDETPLKVQRLGPAMTSAALLALVTAAALIATKWLALAAILVIWSAWRAARLAKKDPEWFGGYKTAVATLTLTIVASAGLGAYGIAHIPQAIDNYRLRRVAATNAAMYQYWNALEEYKRTSGSYPRNAQQFKIATGMSAPDDYWGRSIKYQSRTDAIADRSIQLTGIQFINFELRSAGPDGVISTDDDIVMRDGILFTNSEVRNQPVAQQPR